MKRMKRTAALCLCAVMAVMLLAGCGRKEKVQVIIKVPVLTSTFVADPELTNSMQFIEKAWDAFAGGYEKYDVSAQFVEFEQTDYKARITDCYGTENAADLIYGGYFNIAGYIFDGYAAPLDGIISESVRADFDGRTWELSQLDGKTYLMPFTILQNVLCYNKELFRDCGLEGFIPDGEEIQGWSLDEWETVLSTLRERLPENSYPMMMYALNNQGDTHTMVQLRCKGSEFFDENGMFNLSTPEGIAGLQWIKDNYDRGYYPLNCEDMEIVDCTSLFMNGQLAIHIFNTAFTEAYSGMDLGYVNFPAADERGAASAFLTGFMAFDNGDARKLEVAGDFLKFIYETPQWLDYSANGIPCPKSVANRLGDKIFMGAAFAANAENTVDYQANNPNWQGVRDAFYPHIHSLLTGRETAAECAAGLDRDCNAAIEEGYRTAKIHS